jgi:hypothetical protein
MKLMLIVYMLTSLNWSSAECVISWAPFIIVDLSTSGYSLHLMTWVFQAVCSALRHALATLLDDCKPLVPEMLELLVKSYRLHLHPAALDLAKQVKLCKFLKQGVY